MTLEIRLKLIALMMMVVSSSCFAGAREFVTNLFAKKIHIQVSVQDEQGQPVPYATLWFMLAHKDAPERSNADISRLMERYALDYDIASIDSAAPIRAVLVHYTDAKGLFSWEMGENNFQGLAALPVIVGVLKRGYKPLAYEKTMPVGSSHEIVLRLKTDTASTFDPRLLELDEIRSEAGNVFPNWTGEERMAHADRMNSRLNILAAAFERDGKRNEAALAYYNLAYLPSIERMVRPDGKVQVIGYTRGYDEKSLSRKANLAKALALGTDIPQLRCRALIDAFVAQGGRIWNDQSKRELRLRLIEELEGSLIGANERFFPYVLAFLADLYSYVGNPTMACKTIQRAYRFEPRAYEANSWPGFFKKVEDTARKPLKGLPAFPDFICEMPQGN